MPPQDWARPFLLQAQTDLAAAERLVEGTSESTLCMLLQMVFEKLAKAAVAYNGTLIDRSHKVMSRLIPLMRRDPATDRILVAAPHVELFVQELENANPAVAPRGMPILEYPWEDSSGTVRWPDQHLHLVRRVRDPKDRIVLDCLKFARSLVAQLDNRIP